MGGEDIIHQSVRISCAPKEAFEYFTVNDKVEAWFSNRADIEPEQGGRYELFWDSPPSPPNRGTAGCVITAYEPYKLLSFDWKGPDMFASFMNDGDRLTHVTVGFFPGEGAGACTEVHVVHAGWGSSPAWDEARHWFENAWVGLLAGLNEQVQGSR